MCRCQSPGSSRSARRRRTAWPALHRRDPVGGELRLAERPHQRTASGHPDRCPTLNNAAPTTSRAPCRADRRPTAPVRIGPQLQQIIRRDGGLPGPGVGIDGAAAAGIDHRRKIRSLARIFNRTVSSSISDHAANRLTHGRPVFIHHHSLDTSGVKGLLEVGLPGREGPAILPDVVNGLVKAQEGWSVSEAPP